MRPSVRSRSAPPKITRGYGFGRNPCFIQWANFGLICFWFEVAGVITIRLGDDANSIIGSESQGKLSTSWSTSIGVSQIVTVSGASETWSLDAAPNNTYAGRYIRATCPANGTAGKGSYICALRIQ